MGINRRTIMGLLAATAASFRVTFAQAPAASASPDQDLQAARAERQRDAQRIAAVKLPQTTEPAFQF
jgi:hypothetical protein